MQIEKFLNDYQVPYVTEGNKHCTEGWINIHCPFCAGSRNYHLGIHEDGNGAHCWRCGGHSIISIIKKLTGASEQEARSLFRKYKGANIAKRRAKPIGTIFPIKYPEPYFDLNALGDKYLIARDFSPQKIKNTWQIKQTGAISLLDGQTYNHRLLIPIFWHGELVSFQTRDITGRSEYKYLACPQKREKKNHKLIFYGKQEELRQYKRIIITEGVTDVWRLGKSAVATFGIKFKLEQVLALAGHGERFIILFDNEPQAQKQAQELKIKLNTLGKSASLETVKGDPAELSQQEADYLVKNLQK